MTCLRALFAFAATLALSACAGTLWQAADVATGAACYKECRVDYEDYKSGMPEGQASAAYQACAATCESF